MDDVKKFGRGDDAIGRWVCVHLRDGPELAWELTLQLEALELHWLVGMDRDHERWFVRWPLIHAIRVLEDQKRAILREPYSRGWFQQPSITTSNGQIISS